MVSKTMVVTIIVLVILTTVVTATCLILCSQRNKEGYMDVIALLPEPIAIGRITIVTFETRTGPIFDEMNALHNENVSRYAQIHGYEYMFLAHYEEPSTSHPLLKSKRVLSPYWQKLLVVRDLLYKQVDRPDVVMWMDSDTVVCSMHVRIESILNISQTASVYIGKDNFGSTLCAGMFIVRNTEEGRKFVDGCCDDYMQIIDTCYRDIRGLYGTYAGMCYEQGIMNKRLKGSDKDISCILPISIMRNSTKHKEGSMFAHYYGNKKNTIRYMNQLRKSHSYILGYYHIPDIIHIPRVAILLTMYGTESRRSMYLKRLDWWYATQLNVYSVCSKGDNLFVNYPNHLSFKQKKREQKSQPSNTERISIINAIDTFNMIEKYDIVFKVTCKYIVPGLSELLQHIHPLSDFILQSRFSTNVQHCEVIGARPGLLRELMKYKTNISLEESLHLFSRQYISKRLPTIKILPEYRTPRSDGKVLLYL